MYLYSSSSSSTKTSSTSLHKNKNKNKNNLNTSYINYITKSMHHTKTQPKMTDPTPTQQPTTPTTEDQQKKEALAAFAATLHSVGTNLETPLRDRATTITSNAAALEKQEAQLAESTARLARQNREWDGLADETRSGLKEIGDVQNWAEMIERDLLVLEEMMDGVEREEREVQEGEGEGEMEERDGEEGVNGNLNGKKDGASERQGGWLRWW